MADPTRYEYKCYYRYTSVKTDLDMRDWIKSVKHYYGGVEYDYDVPSTRYSIAFVVIFWFTYIEDAVEFKLRFG